MTGPPEVLHPPERRTPICQEVGVGHDLWRLFQRVGENALRGGQPGRSAQGRRLQTRPVGSIDRGVSLNRALWMLAEEMRKLKA